MSIFCSPSSSPYIQDDCGSPGGVIAMGIVDDSVNPTEEQRGQAVYWQGLVDAGLATILTGIRGQYLGGEVQEAAGFALDAVQLIGVKHTATTEFRGLKENGGISPLIRGHKMVLFLYSGHVLWINSWVVSTFKLNIPKDPQKGAYWIGTHVWQDFQNPTGPDPLDDIIIVRPPDPLPTEPVWLWESGQFVLWDSGQTADLE